MRGHHANAIWPFAVGQLWTPNLSNSAGRANTSCQISFDSNFYGFSTCRPFLGSASAPVDMVGICTNAAAADCGLVDFFPFATSKGVIKNPVSKSAVHWIYDNNAAGTFFGTPYGNVGRNPGLRGQAVSAVDFSMFKTTKVTERLSLRLEAQAYNLFNHMFLGVPDPIVADLNLANNRSLANTFSHSTGARTPTA